MEQTIISQNKVDSDEGLDSKRTPLVVAVVLTWNDTKMTERCIESVLGNDYGHFNVVLVDNGSIPPCAPVLKNRFSSIDTVQLERNFGFTGGCNRGIEKAISMRADYIFLLNNDTIVDRFAISKLVTALEKNPKAGLAHALLLYPGDERVVQFYSATVMRDSAYHIHPEDGKKYNSSFSKTIETEFVPACALLYRTQTLLNVGLFDEKLFTNWEDYDLHLRIVDAGWRLLTVGEAEVIHAHGQTTGLISPFITYFSIRNRLICLFRFGKPFGILSKSLFISRTLWWQIKNHGVLNLPAQMAFLKGVLHFFLGIRGEGGVSSDRSN